MQRYLGCFQANRRALYVEYHKLGLCQLVLMLNRLRGLLASWVTLVEAEVRKRINPRNKFERTVYIPVDRIDCTRYSWVYRYTMAGSLRIAPLSDYFWCTRDKEFRYKLIQNG